MCDAVLGGRYRTVMMIPLLLVKIHMAVMMTSSLLSYVKRLLLYCHLSEKGLEKMVVLVVLFE